MSDRAIYRVESGGNTRWFLKESDAVQYVDDRIEHDTDGRLWVESIDLTEVIPYLNELEYLREHLASFRVL